MNKYDDLKKIPISIPIRTWDWTKVRSIRIEENGEKLVPLSLAPDKILVSPQYYIQGISGALPECYARETVYHKLIEASKLLPRGYKLVILDCWRPLKIQYSLFEILKRELKKQFPLASEEEINNETLKYVALPSNDPARPSPHNTGGAVDLTIADEDGNLLNMGTGFDDTTPKSRTIYFEELLERGENLNAEELEALENRRLLYHIMTSVGFSNYLEEWWHYDYGNQNWAWMKGKDVAIYGKTVPLFPWRKDIE